VKHPGKNSSRNMMKGGEGEAGSLSPLSISLSKRKRLRESE
jgi:hypothetical protein